MEYGERKMMEQRLKIGPEVQKRYLLEVEEKSGLKGEELARLFGVVGRSYRDWKRGKYSITAKAASVVECSYGISFPADKNRAIADWVKSKSEGGRRGGFACFLRHGSPGTLEGRKLGGSRALAIMREKGIIPEAKHFVVPNKLSERLAEFVGIMLGDGHLGQFYWSITLNSIADRDYLEFVIKLIRELFEYESMVYWRKDAHAVNINGGNPAAIRYFCSLGMVLGNKVVQQVGVPEWIRGNIVYRVACTRGLMDTDGGIFTHKYKVNGKMYSYKKVCFSNRSVPLLNFVSETLKFLGFYPKSILDVQNKKVWLYNTRETERYLKIVGTHNSRLIRHFQEGIPIG